MPTLEWIGKEKVINHHQEVPYKILKHKYGFKNGKKIEKITNIGNKIIHGDNLEVLKSLLPEYENKVNCIYIDPPYNTGEEKWIYNDNVNHPKIKKWLGEVVGKEEEDLTRHDKWLCMMYPRLKLLHKLLSEDGVIFISIDENELYSLKFLLDEIFGKNNFVGQYMWYKSATPPNLSYKIKRNLEYVLCYEKSNTAIKFRGVQKSSPSNDPMTKPQNTFKELKFPKGTIKFPFKNKRIPANIYGTKKFPNELLNDIIVIDGFNSNEIKFRNRFIWIQETLEKKIKEDVSFFASKNLVLSYKKKKYDREVPPSLIDDSVGVSTTEEAGKQLKSIFEGKKIFDYPKPFNLIEYLLQFTNKKNAIVLDSFAGSGTTAHAVLNLNKKDDGNRKFILIEMDKYAEKITAERVKRVINGYSDIEGTGGEFNYYELGEPLFISEDVLNENIDIDIIRQYIFYTETKKLIKSENKENEYFLGSENNADYYFYYEKDEVTVLNYDFIATLQKKAEQYVIYADKCSLSKDELVKINIIFKKIPRDITRL